MTRKSANALEEWRSIVGLVRGLLDDEPARDLDARRDAASIVVAALGSPSCVYDWSWMLPFGPWMGRMRYSEKPLEPSLRLLEAINAWVAAQLEPLEDGLQRTVQLRDEPGGALRTATVASVLHQEFVHARDHVDEIRQPA